MYILINTTIKLKINIANQNVHYRVSMCEEIDFSVET